MVKTLPNFMSFGRSFYKFRWDRSVCYVSFTCPPQQRRYFTTRKKLFVIV